MPGLADFELRPFGPIHLDRVVDIWTNGWREAHAAIVPPDLARLRTRDSFRQRTLDNASGTRLILSNGTVLGFSMVKDDELYQLYVAPEGRGSGAACVLIEDAERHIRANGHSTAWLACTVGNHRAARFYERSDWTNTGVRSVDLDTSNGAFPLDVWRFEKPLSG